MNPVPTHTHKFMKELGSIGAGIGVVLTIAFIFSTVAQYRLSKVNKELAQLQIKKLNSEGFK